MVLLRVPGANEHGASRVCRRTYKDRTALKLLTNGGVVIEY